MAIDKFVPITDLGKSGLITDVPSYTTRPEAWSNARNVRFSKSGVGRMAGHTDVFGTPSVAPVFLLNVPAPSDTYWIYTSLTEAHVYDGASHTEITNVGGDYTTVSYKDWNATIFGGIPILNNGVDTPQVWASLSPATPLTDLPDFTTTGGTVNILAKKLIGFGPFLVALNVTYDGTNYPHVVAWSHSADPGSLPDSWDHLDPTKDAGQIELTDVHGGKIVDGEMLGNQLIIYKENAVHAMRYIGGISLFRTEPLLTTSGILASKCMTTFNKGLRQFVVSADDILIHAGSSVAESIAEDRVRKMIFSEMDSTNYANSFCYDNSPMGEVWFHFPSNGNTTPNVVAIWDYKNNTWSMRDLKAVAADRGALSTGSTATWDSDADVWDIDDEPWSNTSLERMIVVTSEGSGKFYNIDSGTLFDDANPTCFVERTGIAFDGRTREGVLIADFSTVKLVHRLWLRVHGTAKLNVQVGAQEEIDGTVYWSDQQEFDPTVDRYLDFDTVGPGRLLAFRVESTGSQHWILSGYDLEYSVISYL